MTRIPRSIQPLALIASLVLMAGCNSAPSGPTTESGALENGDSTLGSGELYDQYTVNVGAGKWLRVRIDSGAFDPYLIVHKPGGEQSDLDDSVPGNTEMVELKLRADDAGDYRIVVTTYAPGATGAYTLTYEVTDAEPTLESPPATTTADDSGMDDAGMDDSGDDGSEMRGMESLEDDADAPADADGEPFGGRSEGSDASPADGEGEKGDDA